MSDSISLEKNPNSGGIMTSLHENDPLLLPKDAARLLGISATTLANWRVAGKGPHFIKLGESRTSAIRYRRSIVEQYLMNMTRSSTVDSGHNKQ